MGTPVYAIEDWDVKGPFFKNSEQYLSRDGDNTEAPWPGYGWPLGTECYFFVAEGNGHRVIATGVTVESAWRRTVEVVATRSKDAKCAD